MQCAKSLNPVAGCERFERDQDRRARTGGRIRAILGARDPAGCQADEGERDNQVDQESESRHKKLLPFDVVMTTLEAASRENAVGTEATDNCNIDREEPSGWRIEAWDAAGQASAKSNQVRKYEFSGRVTGYRTCPTASSIRVIATVILVGWIRNHLRKVSGRARRFQIRSYFMSGQGSTTLGLGTRRSPVILSWNSQV